MEETLLVSPDSGAGNMQGPGAEEALQPLKGGQLLSAISTSIVRTLREHYGRGPMKAKTYVLDDIIVVVMRGSGFTPLEQTIMDSGEPERVVEMRHDFQRVIAKRYSETIEQLTGRIGTACTDPNPFCRASGANVGQRPVSAPRS